MESSVLCRSCVITNPRQNLSQIVRRICIIPEDQEEILEMPNGERIQISSISELSY